MSAFIAKEANSKIVKVFTNSLLAHCEILAPDPHEKNCTSVLANDNANTKYSISVLVCPLTPATINSNCDGWYSLVISVLGNNHGFLLAVTSKSRLGVTQHFVMKQLLADAIITP